MDVNNTSTANYNSTSVVRSVFFCPQIPDFIWDLNNTTFPWIMTVLIFIASPVTVLLNTLAIVAMKRRRELQKLANILLCSMALTDLLTGAITMPLSSTVGVLILRQASFDHICTLDALVNKPLIFFLSLSSLFHLTAIAWERYMVIQKWIDYRNKLTKSLLKKLGITAWLLAVFMSTVLIVVAGVERKVLKFWSMGEIVVIVGCLVAIAYFYIMVFLGVRKRKQNQISQVTVLMKAKLEYKVAKTTGLLTAGLISSFVPSVGITMLGNFFPVFRMNSAFRLAETLVQFNSLLNPILYSYRDRRFRNAVLELLGMRKSPKPPQPIDAVRCFRRKDPFGSVELVMNNAKTFTSRLTRSASTGQAVYVEIGEAPKISLKRSSSYPTLNKYGDSSFASNFKPQQPSSILITSAVIHSESSNRRKPRDNKGEIHPAVPIANDAISPKRSATPTRTSLTRSKSWENRAYVEVCNSCQTAQVRTITRENSAP